MKPCNAISRLLSLARIHAPQTCRALEGNQQQPNRGDACREQKRRLTARMSTGVLWAAIPLLIWGRTLLPSPVQLWAAPNTKETALAHWLGRNGDSMAHLPDGIYEYEKEQRVAGAPAIPRRVTFKNGQMVELIEFGNEVPPRFYEAYEYGVICDIAREIALQQRHGGERVRYEPLPSEFEVPA